MVEKIYKRIWELSPHVQTCESYSELVELTGELQALYNEQGRLNNPFLPVQERILSLPIKKIRSELHNSVCIVTGGLGCVGSILVRELLKFNVKSVIILDINLKNNPFSNTQKVITKFCDIRNLSHVKELFSQYQPNLVFHTAAQRDPGFAELNIKETLTTNILGTRNIVEACEATLTVKQMVFSSTGKASRYYTEEIYAASKKICEFILDSVAKKSLVKYTLVRFTHILDNSLMNMGMKKHSEESDHVPIHSPGKYVIAQNALEASYLMLNGLIYSKKNQSRLLTVGHLEWPVESLEVALYHITQSKRMIPITFIGNPKGYAEKFFRGQMDWSKTDELNLLINVYEMEKRKLNETGDIIISHICSIDTNLLEGLLSRIEVTHGEKEMRLILRDGLKEIVTEQLRHVNKEKTMDILEWGLAPAYLEAEHIQAADYGAIVPLLMESLEGSRYYHEVGELVYQRHNGVIC